MVTGAVIAAGLVAAAGGIGYVFRDYISDFLLAAAASLLNGAIGTVSLDEIYKTLSLAHDYDFFWDIVNQTLTFVEPFGYALVTTYFLIHLFDAAAKDQVTVDSVIRVLVQLVLVVALISNLDGIINAFLSISESILGSLHSNGGGGQAMSSLNGYDIVEAWHATGEDTALTILIQSALIWLIHWVAYIAVCFAVITRLIEIGWRTAFAPIGIANCFDGGANSKGIQYLKTLFVTCLSGAVIYVVAEIGFALCAVYASSGDTGFGQLLMAAAALLATAGASIGVSQKVRDLA